GTFSVLVTMNVGGGGHGTFTQSGGTTTIGSGLYVIGGGSGLVTISGGSFSAGNASNQGTINQLGGVSHLGAVGGSNGLLFAGATSGAAATMNVTSFAQSGVTVRTTGHLLVTSNAARLTNTATTVTIQGNGVLDLANHALLTST